MRKPSKAKCQLIHAKKRAKQRFGVELNRHDMKQIIGAIQAGEATPVMKQSNRLSVFVVNSQDTDMYAVYDKHRKTVTTFLTEEMVRDNLWIEDEVPAD